MNVKELRERLEDLDDHLPVTMCRGPSDSWEVTGVRVSWSYQRGYATATEGSFTNEELRGADLVRHVKLDVEV